MTAQTPSNPNTLFLIGPGFIGLSLLPLLTPSYTITVLIRNPSAAHAITSLGAHPVIGTLDSSALITQHSSLNRITIHTATADHLPSVQAVLEGLKQRVERGEESVFIHTSGTSVLDDGSNGAFLSSRIFRDDEPEGIDGVPDDAPHREVDLAIVRAARGGLSEKAKVAIMIPPLIYGFNAQNRRLSIQIPTLARFALKHGFAGFIGEGLSVESYVHVADLARGYGTLLAWMENATPEEVARNPYFFCESGEEVQWREVGEKIGESLFKKGLIKEKEARSIPRELYGDLFVS